MTEKTLCVGREFFVYCRWITLLSMAYISPSLVGRIQCFSAYCLRYFPGGHPCMALNCRTKWERLLYPKRVAMEAIGSVPAVRNTPARRSDPPLAIFRTAFGKGCENGRCLKTAVMPFFSLSTALPDAKTYRRAALRGFSSPYG